MSNKVVNKMGGFIRAEFIPLEDVDGFYIKNNRAYLEPVSSDALRILSFVKNGVSATTTVANEKTGQIVDISVNIFLKNEFAEHVIPHNRCLLILTDSTGLQWVYGSVRFPLTLSVGLSQAEAPAGFSGHTLSFTGRQISLPVQLAE